MAFNSKMTLDDALIRYDNEHLITKDNETFLTLIYQKTVFSQYAYELINIPDQSFQQNYSFAGSSDYNSIPVDGLEIPIDFPYQYSLQTFDGKSLDILYVKSGQFHAVLTNNSPTFVLVGDLIVSMPRATLNGTPLYKVVPIKNEGNNKYSIDIDLTGYKFVDPLVINFRLKIKNGTNLDANNNFSIEGTFKNILFREIIGKLGNYKFTKSDLKNTVDVNIFKNPTFKDFRFSLKKPLVGILVKNAYGIPIDLNINTLKARDGKNPPYNLDITGSGIPSVWHINAPTVQEIGQTDTTNLYLTYQNTNLQPCIEMFPKYVDYELSAETQNYGNTNFIIDTSRFSVDVRVELPLWGYVKDFVFKPDTMESFDFNKTMGDAASIQSILMKINMTNGFPVECDAQIYFVDENYNKLDSLIPPPPANQLHTIAAAPTYKTGDMNNPNEGKVINPVHSLIQVSLDRDRIERRNLKKSKWIIITGKLSTEDAYNTDGITPVAVKFYSNYNLEVKVSAQSQLSVKF
jgi:hypothetical protein